MIQETHLSETEHLKLKREWVDQVYASSFGRKRVLLKKYIYFTHGETHTDKEGRFVMVKGEIGRTKITLLNLYAPNEDCPQFFKNIGSILADKAEGITLIGGDFNCALKHCLDKLLMGRGPISKKSKTLNSMMDEPGSVDVWGYLHPREKDFTFMSPVHGTYSRLDLFLISGADSYKVSECIIEPIIISDHALVFLKLKIGPHGQSKYWRLNVSLLNDEKNKRKP